MHDARSLDRLAVALRAAMPRWGLSQQSTLALLAVSENATFRVTDPASRQDIVLRVHRPGYHTAAEIGSELAWLGALDKEGIVPTLTPVPLRDGGLMAEIDPGGPGRRVVAFGFLPGSEPAPDADLVRRFRQLGAITARLHAHVRSWTRPPGFVRKVWDFEAMLGKRKLWGDWRDAPGLDAGGRQLLEDTASALKQRLDDYGSGPHRFGLIHADLRLANLLVEGDALSVIDFDDCGFSWYLYDFAAAVSFIEDHPALPDLQAAWIEGYRTVAPLAEADLTMLPVFVMLRRMLLTAWIASHAETPTAQALGTSYTLGTVELARAFLRDEAAATQGIRPCRN